MRNEDDSKALEQMAKSLASNERPSGKLVDDSSKAILDVLQSGENTAFALMLFRLIVLHPPEKKKESSSFSTSLEWVVQQLTSNKTNMSPATRAMAWCVLSNAYGTSSNSLSTFLEPCIEAAMSDLSFGEQQAHVQVRQAAAAFLYNVSLELSSESTEELSDTLVSLLCASLDGVSLETDDLTRLRRLVVAANICKPCGGTSVNTAATSLVNDLGFVDSLRDIAATNGVDSSSSGDAVKVQQVTKEFLSILE